MEGLDKPETMCNLRRLSTIRGQRCPNVRFGLFLLDNISSCVYMKARLCYTRNCGCNGSVGPLVVLSSGLSGKAASFIFTSPCHYGTKTAKYPMSNPSAYHPRKGGSPAQAASEHAKSNAQNLLDDFFSQPERINEVRRHLRVWFINNVLDWEDNWGSTLSDQIVHYEILDELLTELLAASLHPSNPID